MSSPRALGARAMMGLVLSKLIGPGPEAGGRKPPPALTQPKSNVEKLGVVAGFAGSAANAGQSAAPVTTNPTANLIGDSLDIAFSLAINSEIRLLGLRNRPGCRFVVEKIGVVLGTDQFRECVSFPALPALRG